MPGTHPRRRLGGGQRALPSGLRRSTRPGTAGPRAGLLLTREGGRVAAFVRAEEEPHGGRQPQEAGGWEFVRTFSGWTQHTLELGLFAQAPFSDGCTAAFESPHLGGRALRDRR
ncbi:hypothetical protein GQS52_03680 [Streptomyces sp. SCUT-3]|uniref:hypothetical protein n=1 Tax=Streptomyces sp. SCUT-3 TaxID=2684469 RepID=UPI0015FBAD76|nr:hypothetical protein [Streptomyces sp. SCUT-3]QMV21025.1 hypothetical protein GQS52_03680 [Streptomyces sp. SCUT-3]